MSVRVLNPTLVAKSGFQPAPRLGTLDGKVLGVLYNGRPGGDVVLNDLLTQLKAKYSIATVMFRTKARISNAAPEEILAELQESCDAVITGVGD